MGVLDAIRRSALARASVRPVPAASALGKVGRLVLGLATVAPLAVGIWRDLPWLSVLTFLPLVAWYAWAARDAQLEVDSLTDATLTLQPHVVAAEVIPNRYVNTPEGWGELKLLAFSVVNTGNLPVTLRAQLVRQSVRNLCQEYPVSSAYLRWPLPDTSEAKLVAPGGDARVDVAFFIPSAPGQADAFQPTPSIRFLGPGEMQYIVLNIATYGSPVTGLIDIETLPDGQVERYAFTIEAGPSHPVGMTVEKVARG